MMINKITFFLTQRGFCSEIVTLIYTAAYAKLNNVELVVNDRYWNATYQKGYFDYFHSNKYFKIDNKQSLIFTDKYKLKKFSELKSFLDYLYIVHSIKTKHILLPKKGVKKFLIPLFTYFFEKFITRHDYQEIHLLGNHLKPFKTESSKIWETILEFQSEKYDYQKEEQNFYLARLVSDIAIDIWKLNQFSQITPFLPSGDHIGVHVRRGDKLIEEANRVDVDYFIEAIENKGWQDKPIFISTDDYSVISEFRHKRSHWAIHTFCAKNSRGHEQESFNKYSKGEIYKQNLDFLKEIDTHIRSTAYLGSITSNVTKLIALIRNNKNSTFSVDSIDSEIYSNFYLEV